VSSLLFISDLHLDPARPEVTRLFLEFLQAHAGKARALYILGDLFEAWIGDDDPDPHHGKVQDALRAFAAAGTRCYFMHGNRDFLCGSEFAARSGLTLLDDPTVVDIFGRRALLMHGDTLCTDDIGYQQFRAMVRNPDWQRQFLSQPLAARQAFAEKARQGSKAAQADLAEDIMDVNAAAVAKAFRDHNVDLLVHGHTHRPGVHLFELDGKVRERVVLGDWYEQGSLLEATPAGLSLMQLPLPG